MDDKRIRLGVWLSVIGLLVVVAMAVFIRQWHLVLRAPGEAAKSHQAAPTAPPAAPSPPAASSREPRPATRTAAAPAEPVPYIEGMVYGDIDLREARALMPDNLYWKLGSPTKDPDVLAEREADKEKRNEEYGKVLSGDANEDEVRAYYDYRKRLATDYLEFSEFMARRYRNSDNKEFVSMLELAMKMNAEKLSLLPAELEDALQRSREHEKMREDWRRQKEEFGDMGNKPADDDE